MLNGKDRAKELLLDSGPSHFPGPVNRTGDYPGGAQVDMAAADQRNCSGFMGRSLGLGPTWGISSELKPCRLSPLQKRAGF